MHCNRSCFISENQVYYICPFIVQSGCTMKGQKKLGTPTTPNEKNDTQTVCGDVPSRGHSSANKENFCADRKRLNRKRQQRVGVHAV